MCATAAGISGGPTSRLPLHADAKSHPQKGSDVYQQFTKADGCSIRPSAPSSGLESPLGLTLGEGAGGYWRDYLSDRGYIKALGCQTLTFIGAGLVVGSLGLAVGCFGASAMVAAIKVSAWASPLEQLLFATVGTTTGLWRDQHKGADHLLLQRRCAKRFRSAALSDVAGGAALMIAIGAASRGLRFPLCFAGVFYKVLEGLRRIYQAATWSNARDLYLDPDKVPDSPPYSSLMSSWENAFGFGVYALLCNFLPEARRLLTARGPLGGLGFAIAGINLGACLCASGKVWLAHGMRTDRSKLVVKKH